MGQNNLGYNQENIQDLNRTLLLNLLRREGVCSRATLSHLSGLKQATVTNIVNDFIRWRIVKETGSMAGSKGRRAIGICINEDTYAVVGVRIARLNYSVGLFSLAGNVMKLVRKEVSLGQIAEVTFSQIREDIRKMISSCGYEVLAIGIALPGPYSYNRKRIEIMTGVLGWADIAIEDELEKDFSIPVFIEQDANAAAMAQFWYGRQEDDSSADNVLVYVAAGQGVGAGIVINGKLLKGNIGTAGEIGHTTVDIHGPRCSCGNYGCLENLCSSIAFTKAVNLKLHSEMPLSLEKITKLVRKGDETAVSEYKKCCEFLSVGVINLINSFNPTRVIIGDEMAHIEPDLMLSCIRSGIKDRLIEEVYDTTCISTSIVEHDSMVHGAAIRAIREIYAAPARYFSKSEQGEKIS